MKCPNCGKENLLKWYVCGATFEDSVIVCDECKGTQTEAKVKKDKKEKK